VGVKHETKRARAVQQIETVRAMAQMGDIAAVVWYRGLTAKEMYEFQIAARKVDVTIKVIRNRLAHRALEGTAFVCLQAVLEGPVLLVFSKHGPRVVAGLLRDFSKSHDKLVVKHLAFEGELLPASDLDTMADLPNKEEAVTLLLSVLQSPLHQLLSVLVEPQARLVRTLVAIQKD
jgi:large subunit ribosomal protein L10